MIGDIQRRLTELRFLDGIEKVEHVPYPTGDQFWVRFNRPLDFEKLAEIAKKYGCVVVRFAGLLSKLPRGLSEMLWDGVSHVIVKRISGWSKFTSSLGFEPEGIAKVATDLHGPYQIFMTMDEEGIQILYDYLGVKYVPPPPPPPPPKPATPAKPATAPVARPVTPTAPPPAVPVSGPAANRPASSQSMPQSQVPKPPAQQPPAEPSTAQVEQKKGPTTQTAS